MNSNVVALLQRLIACPSISPNDHGCQAVLQDELKALGFECTALCVEGISSFWAEIGDAGPLLAFAGHSDVVPPGDVGAWTSSPFEGAIRDGFLFGRGAVDMKGQIAAFMVAIERFLTKVDVKPMFRLGVLVAGDEECLNNHGTTDALEVVEQRHGKIDYCIVTEPTSAEHLGDTIKIGRRGSIQATLRIFGKQGHSAYPELAVNPITESLLILQDLIELKLGKAGGDFPAANLQITNIRSGTGAGNVIPGILEAQFNIRFGILPDEPVIRRRVEQILRKSGVRYELDWSCDAQPFIVADREFASFVTEVVHAETGLKPSLSTGGGTSDARFIAARGTTVLEIGLVGETSHMVDECVSIKDLEKLSEVYEAILFRFQLKQAAK